MNATTTSNPSSAEVLATWPDSTLDTIIIGIQDGSLAVPEISTTTLRACLRAAQIEAAKRKARRLLTDLGPDHPRAFVAMLEYVELADPGSTERALKESGINLPAPTHVDGNGTPFYASEAIANALELPLDQVQEEIEQMCELAPEFAPAEGDLHRIQ